MPAYMKWEDISRLAAALLREQNLATHVLLRTTARRCATSVGQLLAWGLQQPDFDYTLANRPLAIQAADPGIAQAIKTRDQSLEASIRRVCSFWPVTYLAAFYRVSPHWVEAMLAAFNLRAAQSGARTYAETPGEKEYQTLTRVQRVQKLNQALASIPEPYTPEKVAIALGIPPKQMHRYAIDIDKAGGDWGPQGQERIARHRSTNAEFEQLKDRIWQYSSVSEYAIAEGLSYPTAYRRAMKVGFNRISHKGLYDVKWKELITQELQATGNKLPKTTKQWVLYCEDEASRVRVQSRNYCLKALRELGMVRKCLVPGLFVWLLPGQEVTQEDLFRVLLEREKNRD